jgi:phosphate uptake regulator
MSIIEEGKTRVILQCSLDPGKYEIETLLRRQGIIAMTMLEEAIQSIIDVDPVLAEDVIYREYEANAFYWLIVRLLNSAQLVKSIAEKISLGGTWMIPENRLIAKCIEKIADNAEKLARRAIVLIKNREIDTVFQKEMIEKLKTLCKLTREAFRNSMACIFSGNIKTASDTLDMKELIDEEEEKLLMSELEPHFSSIVLCLASVAENSATIAAIAINRALENPTKISQPYVEDSVY